jgi:hypothetical protein
MKPGQFIPIKDLGEKEQIMAIERFFQEAFKADKAELIPMTDELKEKIEIKSIVKISTSDRGSFYLSMLDDIDKK